MKKALNLQQKTYKTLLITLKQGFMKKRILLSLVSFFMMTTMWASLIEAYQIYVTAAGAGKTYGTAELTLNMKNRNAIATWECTLVLPEGVTFVSADVAGSRYPEGYNGQFTTTQNEDGSISFNCEGEEGVTLTGTDGAVATVTVAIAGDAPLGDCKVYVKNTVLTEPNETEHNYAEKEFAWTIEEGEAPNPGIIGDLNGDEVVDIADAVTVLDIMAASGYSKDADLNNDDVIDIADYVSVLDIMAAQ